MYIYEYIWCVYRILHHLHVLSNWCDNNIQIYIIRGDIYAATNIPEGKKFLTKKLEFTQSSML
jgi:hypothetical protein